MLDLGRAPARERYDDVARPDREQYKRSYSPAIRSSVKLSRTRRTGPPVTCSQFGILQILVQGGGHRVRIPNRHELRVPAILYEFRIPAGAGRHDRQPVDIASSKVLEIPSAIELIT